MLDALRSYLSLANGLTEVTRERAKAAARAVVSQGEATADQVGSLADDLVATSRANSEAVVNLIRAEIDRALSRLGLVTSDELAALQARVRELERERTVAESPAAPSWAAEGRQPRGGGLDAAGRRPPATQRSGPTGEQPTKRAAKQPAKRSAKKTAGTTATNKTTATTRSAAAQTRSPVRRTTKRSSPRGGSGQ